MASDEVAEAKRVLRRQMRDVRALVAADPDDRARRSAQIWDGLVDAVASCRGGGPHGGLAVMLFDSLPTEPDTAEWFADATGRGWTAYVPEVDGEALHVVPGRIDPTLLDAVVFPGLAFTSSGERLGQGGGHYDRFARRLDAACLRIGVCFAEQVIDRIPHEPHDERVDVVIADG